MIENGDFCDVSKSGENFGKLQSVSNSKIRRLIVSGSVKVNGKVVTRPGFELRGKFVVECFIDEEKFFYEKQPDDIDFVLTKDDVIFED